MEQTNEQKYLSNFLLFGTKTLFTKEMYFILNLN